MFHTQQYPMSGDDQGLMLGNLNIVHFSDGGYIPIGPKYTSIGPIYPYRSDRLWLSASSVLDQSFIW